MDMDENGEVSNEAEVRRQELEELKGLSVEDIVRIGQKALLAELVSAVRSGTASHQEMAILRNILKDNGATLGIPPEQPEEGRAPLDLPTFDKPEYLTRQ